MTLCESSILQGQKVKRDNLLSKKKLLITGLALTAVTFFSFGFNYGRNLQQNEEIDKKKNTQINSIRSSVTIPAPKLETVLKNDSINFSKDQLKVKSYFEKGFVTKEGFDSYMKNNNSNIYSLFQEEKIDFQTFLTYVNANPFINQIKSLEDTLQIPEYRFLIGAESSYNPNSLSSKNAVGLSQMTKGELGGISGVFHKRQRDKNIIAVTLNKDKVNNLVINDYFGNMGDFTLEQLDFKKSQLDKLGISEIELKEVIIPRYLALSKIGVDDLTPQMIENDTKSNLIAGAAHYFSGKLELSILRAHKKVENDKIIVWFEDAPRSQLRKNLNLSAFLWNWDEFAIGAYNAGVPAFKNKYKKVVANGKYDTFRKAVDETKIHRARIEQYKNSFKELESLGLF